MPATTHILKYILLITFQFDGVDFFYWIDQSGSNHSFREIGNSTICDEKEPTLLQETAEVSSKEMLPLTGFSYGPISYENQELSVKIGELLKLNFSKGPSVKEVGIFLTIFDTPLPHVGILTLIYLTFTF